MLVAGGILLALARGRIGEGRENEVRSQPAALNVRQRRTVLLLLVLSGIAAIVSGGLIKHSIDSLDCPDTNVQEAWGAARLALAGGSVGLVAAVVSAILLRQFKAMRAIPAGIVIGTIATLILGSTMTPSFGPADQQGGGGWDAEFWISLVLPSVLAAIGVVGMARRRIETGAIPLIAALVWMGLQYGFLGWAIDGNASIVEEAENACRPAPAGGSIPGFDLVSLAIVLTVLLGLTWTRSRAPPPYL